MDITVYRREHTEDDCSGYFWSDSREHVEALPKEVFGEHIVEATLDIDCTVVHVENADAISHDIDDLREEYPDAHIIAGPCDAGSHGNTSYILIDWDVE